MTDLTVRPVSGRRELRQFILLPFRLYEGVDQWVPPLISERKRHLDRRKNPYFQHAEAEYFLARRGERVVGRISAQVDRRFNEIQGNDWGQFGFFECEDDPEVAAALLDAAREWLRDRGRDHLIGPLDFSTNHECGLLVEGHELRPADPRELALPLLRPAARGLWPDQGDGPLQVEPARQRPQRGDADHLRPGREARARARDHYPWHEPPQHDPGDQRVHGDLQRRLGAQLGLRAADRGRDRALRGRAEADHGRELGDGRRDRRGRDGRRRPDAPRLQPGPEDSSAAGSCRSAGSRRCARSARSTRSASSRSASSPSTSTPASPRASTSATSTWPRPRPRRAARWAGSSR